MKRHTVYRITNILNNKEYIGVHSTKNINDGYKGSGALIRKAKKKYGSNNLKKDILFLAKTKEIAYFIERWFVDDEYIKRKDTYNMKVGGYGGATRCGYTNTPEKNLKASIAQKGKPKKNKGQCGKYDKTDDHKTKLSIANTGKKWVSNINEKIEKQVKIQEIDEYIKNGYVLGRKTRDFTKDKRQTFISEEQKKKISSTLKSKPFYDCPHCLGHGQGPSFLRFHFDKCKKYNKGEE